MTQFWRNRITDIIVGVVAMAVVFVTAYVLSGYLVWAVIVGGSVLIAVPVASPVVRILTTKRRDPKAAI